jgi:hypothetical protein
MFDLGALIWFSCIVMVLIGVAFLNARLEDKGEKLRVYHGTLAIGCVGALFFTGLLRLAGAEVVKPILPGLAALLCVALAIELLRFGEEVLKSRKND